jgi:hypothetical protein
VTSQVGNSSCFGLPGGFVTQLRQAPVFVPQQPTQAST